MSQELSAEQIQQALQGITIPPLHNAERWETLDTARQCLFIDLKQHEAAERYKTVR